MAAYLIGDVHRIHDLERFRGYNRDNPPTIEKYGGRFVVRGGAHEVIEGAWQPGRIVVIQFDDLDALKGWYYSPEYREIWKERQASAESNIIFVQGV